MMTDEEVEVLFEQEWPLQAIYDYVCEDSIDD